MSFKSFTSAVKNAPRFWGYFFKDLYLYLKYKKYRHFNGWGLHLYLGRFGGGKTISAVRECYNLCRKYKGVTVLTNLSLTGFPEDTNIIPLTDSQQILGLPKNSIVLIDEIGTIFNSRDWGRDKGGVPKPVYQILLQCRHLRIMMIGTVQFWGLLDKQLRDIAATVTECHSYFGDPFSRYTTLTKYDAWQYDKWFSNPLLPIKPLSYDAYIQTDALRSKYDTLEMVRGMLKAEYIPDDEILANRGIMDFNPEFVAGDKKQKKALGKALLK